MGGGGMPRPQTFPPERIREFYEEATRSRSASHHLQVKAALALLYHVLGSPNPFAECLAPKFAPEKTELRYHASSQVGQLLREQCGGITVVSGDKCKAQQIVTRKFKPGSVGELIGAVASQDELQALRAFQP